VLTLAAGQAYLVAGQSQGIAPTKYQTICGQVLILSETDEQRNYL